MLLSLTNITFNYYNSSYPYRSDMPRGRPRPRSDGDRFRQELQNLKKERIDGNEKDVERESDNKERDAHQIFNDTLSSASDLEIWSEFTYFLQHVPRLVGTVEVSLIEKVERYLRISELKEKMATLNFYGQLKYKGDEYPILDSLSILLGMNLRKIICPPTAVCLLCNNALETHHEVTMVPLHTLSGPLLASKLQWRCRNCSSSYKFRGKNENNANVYYNVDTYGQLWYSNLFDLSPKSLLLQLEAGRNFETFIVEYFRHRAHFKH